MATITGLKADRILQMEGDLEAAITALDGRVGALEVGGLEYEGGWAAASYGANSLVLHNDALYVATAAAVAADVPGAIGAYVLQGTSYDAIGNPASYTSAGNFERFTVNAARGITRIGVKAGPTPIAAGSQLSIADDAGNVLRTGTFASAVPANSWGYVDISEITLQTGTTYRLVFPANVGVVASEVDVVTGIVATTGAMSISGYTAAFRLYNQASNPWTKLTDTKALANTLFEEEFATLDNYTLVENGTTIKALNGAIQPTTRRGPKRLRRNDFSSSDLVQMVEVRPMYAATYGMQLNLGQYLDANNDLMGYIDINASGVLAPGIQQKLAGAYTYGTHPASAAIPSDQWMNNDPLWVVYRKNGRRARLEVWTHDPRLGGDAYLVAHKRVDAAFESAVMTPEIWIYPNSSPADDTAVADGTGTRVFCHYARKSSVRPTGWF